MNTIQIEVKKGEGSKKEEEVSNYSLQGGTTLKSHVLVATCNTFQFVEQYYYYQKSKSHQAWCVCMILGPLNQEGEAINLGTSHKKTMASSSTTQEDGREKTNKFFVVGDCPLQSLKGHYAL